MKNILITVLLLTSPLALVAQETTFGKNKVQYKEFDWKFIQSRHFDIHFYEESYPIAKFTAEVLESAYVEIGNELEYRLQKRVPVFVYNSHNDFQQTNITGGILPEGVGGFTEAFKNRIVIPFTGSYEDYRHVLHHELTHAVVYDLLLGGGSLSSLLSKNRFFDLPLWYAEGYAEYSSRHGWDYFADMVVRDATINNYLAPPQYLGGYLAYKQGQAMVKYIADKYGEDKLGEIIQKGKIHLTMNKALKDALDIDEEQFWKDFSKEMKRRYWPEIARRRDAEEIGKRLTKAREDGSFYNEKPVFSPSGDRIVMFTDKSDYTDIVLISAIDGRVIDKLASAERSGDLESLHSYVSGVSFSPDGKDIVFVAKSQGRESLFFLNVRKKNIHKKKRFDFQNMVGPAWSPDGKRIAFSALKGIGRDIFIYNLETDQVEQVTDDRFDDVDPSWIPGSNELVFASDRPHPQTQILSSLGQPYVGYSGAYMPGDFDYGNYNIFRIELGANTVTPIDVGPGANKNPTVSPNGKSIAFLSNRNGIDNIYIGHLDTVEYYAVTDILTGVQDMSWSPESDQLAFSAFNNGAFDIFVLRELIPAGENGVLEPTDFINGRYNLIDERTGEPVAVSPVKKSEGEPGIDSVTAVTDTTVLAAADSLPKESEVSSEKSTDTTGIYEDDYVYVSGERQGTFDSIMQRMPSEDADSSSRPITEPAVFDSVPVPSPAGEYEIQDYKVKFTPDIVGGGVGYDTFYGLRGQSYFIFSDFLGNHQIYVVTDLVNSIDQSFIQGMYFNQENRINFGAGFFHTKNYYVDPNDFLFSDRFYGVQFFARRPNSIFSRFEASLSQIFIDRKYYDRDLGDNRPDRNAEVTTGNAAYVFDNVLWGLTGPVNGRRMRVNLQGAINLFDSDISFYAGELDYRKYFHFKKTASMAFRITGGASEGRTPKRYFLGGMTNWIGSRDFGADAYEVENLYFADAITPLRGIDYYELSGNRFALLNWELRFPLIQYFALRYPLPIVLSNIQANLFTDIGSAWNDDQFKFGTSQNGDPRLLDVKTGFGFGLRLNLFGFALLRYDLAWTTDFNEISKKPRGYFSLGADF